MPEIGVEIQAIDNTGRGIKNAEKSMGRLKGAVRGVTSAAKLAAFGIGGIAIAGAGIGIALATQFIGAGKEMQRFSNRTGHSVEQLSAMGYAAERVGLELEDMIDVTEEMRIKAFDAAEGSEAMAAHFAELGINVQEFLALDADEQFNLTAEALGNVEDATRRTILADELLSDTGKRLLEVTQSNADGFAGLAAQAAAAGRIMSTDTVSSITRMNSAFVKLKDRGLGLAMGLFEDIAPVLADAAESVLGFADVLQEDGLAGAGDVAWKAMGRLSESLGTESGLGKFVAAAHEEFGNFVEYLWNSDSVFEAVDEYFNISETVDKFTGAIDKAKGGLDGWLEKLGIVKEPTDSVFDGLSDDIKVIADTLDPTLKEALAGIIDPSVQYVGHPVLKGLDADIRQIAATLDPGLKEILQGFSATDTTLTSDLQEIADTIPMISQAFTDETPAITAAISGYTTAAGDIKEVGTTVGDVRDKVDFNVRSIAARLGPLGFPLVALWQGIQGEFKTGREKTVAEVVQMNSDLNVQIGGSTATGGTIVGLSIAAGLMKVAWGVVSDVFGGGREDTVAEVTDMNTDLGTETTATVDELNAAETLFALQWLGIKEVFGVGRDETVAEMFGLNTDIAEQFDLTQVAMALAAGLLTGNWDLVAESFEMGRKDSVAEVDGMNTDVKKRTFQTLEVIDALGRDSSDEWGGVTFTFEQARINTVAEVTGLNKGLETETANTVKELGFWELLLAGEWGSVVEKFTKGRTDSVAEVEGLNSDLETPTASTVRELDYWSNNLGTGWTGVSDEFSTGRVDSVAEVTGMNTDLKLNTGSTITGINVFTTLLGIGLKLVSGEFNTGRVDSVAEVTGMNTDLGTETGTTTTNLSTWVTDKLGPGWQLVKDAFGIGRTDVNTEMTGLNTDLTAAEKTTTDNLDLWNVVLGTWWGVIKGTFNTGRTETVAEVTGLNTDLATPTGDINTQLGTTWKDKLNEVWIDLVSEFTTGKDDSIEEIKGISLYLGEETAGGTGTAADEIDDWALIIHQKFQAFKTLVQGPIDSIVGVINRVRGAVQSAIDAISRLRRERAVPIPSFGPPRSGGGAPGPATGAVGGNSVSGGGGGGGFAFPNDPLALAGGGIVTRPTFALIGEAGPEAIIPLGRGGGVGSTIVVNVNIAGSVVSEHELDTRIHRTVNSALSAGAIA